MSRQCHDSHHDSRFRISFRKYLQITKTVTMSPAFHVEEDQAEKFQAFASYHYPSFSSCIHLRYGLTKLPCFCILYQPGLREECNADRLAAPPITPNSGATSACGPRIDATSSVAGSEGPSLHQVLSHFHAYNTPSVNPTKLFNASISDNRHMASTSTSSQG
jgi:hypothetical protein